MKERLPPRRDGRPVDVARGERRLARWRTQTPFSTGEWFDERLAADGLSRDEMVAILGEAAEPAAERCDEEPAWVAAVRESLSPIAARRPRLAVHPRWQTRTGHELWALVEPIARRARAALDAPLEELARVHRGAPIALESVDRALMSSLPHELLDMPLRTLVLELHVARLEGELTGESAKERFDQFAARLRDPEVALGLFEQYPVLARQSVACAEAWRRTTLELLERLCLDWPLITSAFPGADPSDTLVDLRAGAGDKHRGGRSVTVLSFRSGFKLVYKPRSLTVDAHFQELLGTLDAWGDHPPFRTIGVLDRGSYGWMEHVAARGCRSADEVSRFYRRQGGYLAILHLLRATDMHFENIIAEGEHPVLIDLESILHPAVGDDAPSAEDFLAESVLQVGLLPIRIWENDASPGIDISGLGMERGQITPRADPYWADAGTDRMRFARKHRALTVQGEHRPTLHGEPVAPLDYAGEIVAGFEAIYRLALAHRDELLADGGPLSRFAHDEVRVLLRPTMVYSAMSQESFHPHLLRSGLERDRFFDKLWAQVPSRRSLRRVIGAEQEDLRRGDIPLFTTAPSSRTLWSSTGEPIADFFAEPAMDLVRKRLRDFGDRDLARQAWIIRASMAILSTDSAEREAIRAPADLPPPGARVTRERLQRLAVAVGDRLCDWVMASDDSALWMGLVPVQRHYKIASLNSDLYGGLAGVALFLAYLGHVAGEERYTRLAERSCRAMLDRAEEESGALAGVGAFEGQGGIIYTLSHLAALWGQPSLGHEARRLCDRLPERIDRDTRLDVMGGSAGCIAALATVMRCSPSEGVMRAMLQCGERILLRAVRAPGGIGWVTTGEAEAPMTGLSHGAAGIAAALLELSASSGQARFRDAALEGLRYERGLFSPEHGNWADVRTEKERFDRVNWCHGAPGIGLARVLALRHEDTPEIRNEIAAAVRTTLARGFGRSQSLCHGDLGNLEILIAANACLPDLDLQADIDQRTAAIADEIEQRGYRCGLPLGVETPGLMVGLSGIGYGLLRLAAPDKVPSVLALEPPVTGPATGRSRG